MANFIKHIGKQGDRKVCVLYRQVPREDHMALVIYPEVLPAHWHDAIMKVLESPVGQQADELAEALHRSMLPDGRLILETLHHERMIKKVKTADILMTPKPNSSIRLDELNKMLNEMKQGQEAIDKMAKNDASRGLVDPFTKRAAESEFKESQKTKSKQIKEEADAATADVNPLDKGLTDRDLASNMLTQARQMEAAAKEMVAEAARMKKEAEKMFPAVSTKSAKAAATTPVADAAPKKRGRKPKTVEA